MMSKNGLISGKDNKKLQEKIGLLNKYLHPHFKFTEVGRLTCPACPSSVKFDEKEYKYCVELFQDIATFLLITIYTHIEDFFPEKLDEEEIKEALSHLNFYELEKIIEKKIIFSKELEDFISSLPDNAV